MSDLFTNTGPNPRTIGHGNALFLAALQEPGITKTKLRKRIKAGDFPDLWAGCAQWVELARIA